MVCGILFFATGLVIHTKASKAPKITAGNESLKPVIIDAADSIRFVETGESDIENAGDFDQTNNKVRPENSATELSKEEVAIAGLEHAIRMAIADGVLTKNERQLIKELVEKNGKDYETVIAEIESRMGTLDFASETQLIDFNKKSGDDFEKFVVQKFNPRYFKLKEWAGDKYVDGIYAETTLQPDLLFELTLQGKTAGFAVECKWRSDFMQGGIEFATKTQFRRYREFGRKRNMPVFIAIGVGGKPESPKYFYVVPLSEVNSNFIVQNSLSSYGKRLESNFFFDMETQTLN